MAVKVLTATFFKPHFIRNICCEISHLKLSIAVVNNAMYRTFFYVQPDDDYLEWPKHVAVFRH